MLSGDALAWHRCNIEELNRREIFASARIAAKNGFLSENIGVNERKLLTLRQLTEIAKIIKPYNTKKLHHYYD